MAPTGPYALLAFGFSWVLEAAEETRVRRKEVRYSFMACAAGHIFQWLHLSPAVPALTGSPSPKLSLQSDNCPISGLSGLRWTQLPTLAHLTIPIGVLDPIYTLENHSSFKLSSITLPHWSFAPCKDHT